MCRIMAACFLSFFQDFTRSEKAKIINEIVPTKVNLSFDQIKIILVFVFLILNTIVCLKLHYCTHQCDGFWYLLPEFYCHKQLRKKGPPIHLLHTHLRPHTLRSNIHPTSGQWAEFSLQDCMVGWQREPFTGVFTFHYPVLFYLTVKINGKHLERTWTQRCISACQPVPIALATPIYIDD